MTFPPKMIAAVGGSSLLLVLLIAWLTGDTSDPEEKYDDLASLEGPVADTPFLDDFGTPPSIDDPMPEQTEQNPKIAKNPALPPTAKQEPQSPPSVPARPDTSIAKNTTPATSPKGQDNGTLVKPNKPLPRTTLPKDTRTAKHSPKANQNVPSPPSSKPTSPNAGSTTQKPKSPPVRVEKNTPPKAVPVPPAAQPVPPKAQPLPPKAVPVPPRAKVVVDEGGKNRNTPADTPRSPQKQPSRAIPVEETPPRHTHRLATPALVIQMKSPTQAPGRNRSNVIKQAKDLISANQLNIFLRAHDLPPRAITSDNIGRATHDEAVAFTAWLTHQHRAARIIGHNVHYRLPMTSETSSTQIWRHDDTPTHADTTRPVGIVLAKGAKP